MISLYDLLKKHDSTEEQVNQAITDLDSNPVVELEGVNAPEFKEDLPFDMEDMYASQSTTQSILIPTHDDGLDDCEAELTDQHVMFPPSAFSEDFDIDCDDQPEEDFTDEFNFDDVKDEKSEDVDQLGEDGEPIDWNRKPFSSKYFNFGGRTVNSLARAGYTCFDDIRNMTYSEFKSIAGFGKVSQTEVLEMLEAENQNDWILQMPVDPTPETVIESAPESVIESAPETVIESAPETVIESAPESVIESVPESVIESAPESVAALKILAIGGSVGVIRQGLHVASFEMVYADAIRMICEQASSASLASIEYGKGWSALGATIRNNGWPKGVDVLTVSKSFLSRPEILMELRLLADVVIEG